MAEVSFYILSSSGMHERFLYACKIIQTAYRKGSFCYVLTDSEANSHTLDELLWTFSPNSFIPHQIYQGELPEFPNTILIGNQDAPAQWQNVILNLSSHPPVDLSQSEKVLEILDNDEQIKAMGRERFRHYKRMGIEPITHHIK